MNDRCMCAYWNFRPKTLLKITIHFIDFIGLHSVQYITIVSIKCFHVLIVIVDAQFCPGYYVFLFGASSPFVTNFEFGPRTLSVFIHRVFESFSISYLFCICFASNYLFVVKCHVCVCFVSCRIFRIYLFQLFLFI